MTSAQRRWRPSADAVLNLLAAELNSRQQGSWLPPGRSTSNVYTNEWKTDRAWARRAGDVGRAR
jgi:hypothetical protein